MRIKSSNYYNFIKWTNLQYQWNLNQFNWKFIFQYIFHGEFFGLRRNWFSCGILPTVAGTNFCHFWSGPPTWIVHLGPQVSTPNYVNVCLRVKHPKNLKSSNMNTYFNQQLHILYTTPLPVDQMLQISPLHVLKKMVEICKPIQKQQPVKIVLQCKLLRIG